MQIEVRYYAMLREQSGLTEERLETDSKTPADLYAELRKRYGFTLPENIVRAAVNLEFRPMDSPIAEGDSVAFIPPVAGG